MHKQHCRCGQTPVVVMVTDRWLLTVNELLATCESYHWIVLLLVSKCRILQSGYLNSGITYPRR